MLVASVHEREGIVTQFDLHRARINIQETLDKIS